MLLVCEAGKETWELQIHPLPPSWTWRSPGSSPSPDTWRLLGAHLVVSGVASGLVFSTIMGLALFKGFSCELVMKLLVPFAPLGVDFSMSCRLKDSSEAGR